MTEARVLPPAPAIDHDSAHYWEGTRQELLRLQQCDDCARHRYPPMPHCPYCASARWSLTELSGSGTVYSFVVVHQAFHPAFADDVPYVIATIDLDEGPRIAVRADDADDIDFGQRVVSSYVHHDGWSELRVVPDRSG
jgi:hypothetical protein